MAHHELKVALPEENTEEDARTRTVDSPTVLLNDRLGHGEPSLGPIMDSPSPKVHDRRVLLFRSLIQPANIWLWTILVRIITLDIPQLWWVRVKNSTAVLKLDVHLIGTCDRSRRVALACQRVLKEGTKRSQLLCLVLLFVRHEGWLSMVHNKDLILRGSL